MTTLEWIGLGGGVVLSAVVLFVYVMCVVAKEDDYWGDDGRR